jgi:hypothetical protein
MIPSLEVFVLDIVNCDELLEELWSCEACAVYDWEGAGCGT